MNFLQRVSPRDRALRALAALCALAFAPPILGLLFGYFPLGEDALAYFAPLRSFAATQLRGGTIPLWNPYLFCGQPLAANIQTALWYPPNALYWLLPERFAVLLDALLHTIWLAWGAFAFARALGFGRRAAFLAGALLALGGGTSARIYAGQTIWLAAFSHIPWLLRAELVYLRGGKTRDALFAGAWLALLILTGHPPTALLAILLSCGLVVLWIGTRTRGEAKLPRAWPLAICASGAFALSLSAVAWLPFRELSKLAAHGGALLFSDATILSATWKSLVRLIAPDWFGGNRGVQWSQSCCSHEEAASIGVLPLVLAVAFFAGSVAVFDRTLRSQKATKSLNSKEIFDEASTVENNRTGRARKLILYALPFVFLMAMGANTAFYGWVFDVFPPLRLVRVPSRWLLVWSFAAPFLAAWAWQRIFAENKSAARVLWLLRCVALVFALAAVCVWFAPESFWQHAATLFAPRSPAFALQVADNFRRVALIESALVFLVAGLAGSLVERWQRAEVRLKNRLALLILGFACFEVLLGGWRGAKLVSPKDQNDAFWPSEIAARYKAGERWTTSVFWQGINRAATENVSLANGYDPLGTKNYFAFASQTEGKNFWETLYQPQNRSSLWRVAGVTHTLAQSPDSTDGETPYPNTRGWKLEAKSGRWELWNRNEPAWPRACLAAEIRRSAQPLPLLEKLAAHSRAVFPVVVAPGALPNLPLQSPRIGTLPQSLGSARIVAETPNQIMLETDSSRATALVVSDANYPGWRAWANGKETPVATANGMFRAAEVPRGRARVALVFDSQSVRLGIFLSLCGLFGLAALTQVRSKSTVLNEN